MKIDYLTGPRRAIIIAAISLQAFAAPVAVQPGSPVTYSMFYKLTTASGKITPPGGNTVVVPAPTQCSSQSLSWTTGGNTCKAPSGIVNNNAQISLSSSNGNLGTGIFTCSAATNTYAFNASGSSCTPPVCPASTVNWTVSGVNCTGNISQLSSGQSATVTATNSPAVGSASYTCNAGSLAVNSASCSVPPPVPPANSPYKDILSDGFSTCVITAADTLRCFGTFQMGPQQVYDATSKTYVFATDTNTPKDYLSGYSIYPPYRLSGNGLVYSDKNGMLAVGYSSAMYELPGLSSTASTPYKFTSDTWKEVTTNCGINSQSKAMCWGKDYGNYSSNQANGRYYCGGTYYQSSCGYLGNNVTAQQVQTLPVAVAGSYTFNKIASDGAGTCGISTTDGSAYCWGAGFDIGLGASAPDRYAPAPLNNFSGVPIKSFGNSSVITGGYPQYYMFNALTTAGDTIQWGRMFNSNIDPAKNVSGGVKLVSVAMGAYSLSGIDSSGNGWVWGQTGGASSTSTNVTYSTPQPLLGGQTWKKMVGHIGNGGCGIASTDLMYCWGNNFGFMGIGNNGSKPGINLSFGGMKVSDIVAIDNGGAICARNMADSNKWYCAGFNNRGFLGNGDAATSCDSRGLCTYPDALVPKKILGQE